MKALSSLFCFRLIENRDACPSDRDRTKIGSPIRIGKGVRRGMLRSNFVFNSPNEKGLAIHLEDLIKDETAHAEETARISSHWCNWSK